MVPRKQHYDFHLLSSSILVDNADDSVLPSEDIEGNIRPQGDHGDVGCYELLIDAISIDELMDTWSISVFPNPFQDILFHCQIIEVVIQLHQFLLQ